MIQDRRARTSNPRKVTHDRGKDDWAGRATLVTAMAAHTTWAALAVEEDDWAGGRKDDFGNCEGSTHSAWAVGEDDGASR